MASGVGRTMSTTTYRYALALQVAWAPLLAPETDIIEVVAIDACLGYRERSRGRPRGADHTEDEARSSFARIPSLLQTISRISITRSRGRPLGSGRPQSSSTRGTPSTSLPMVMIRSARAAMRWKPSRRNRPRRSTCSLSNAAKRWRAVSRNARREMKSQGSASGAYRDVALDRRRRWDVPRPTRA
jgi:hypothetical protein